jgi:energy-coupling factor transporter ATP-binding protein EcfA2
VEQFDTLLGILTVEEMLLYTAELKRPMSEPLASKRAAVEEVLSALALTPCRDVRIGNPLVKGISGGQAKRTNIGIALVTNPRVLFLDEPTSGLDSFTANEVMTVIKQLRVGGVTLCATIHSPTAYAFGLFDSLMMLTRGRVVYFGPVGQAAIDYALATWPHDGGGGHRVNGAEWLVDLITGADRDGRAASFADAYAASPLAARNAAALEAYVAESAKVPLPEHLAAELAVQHETVTPWWWGLKTLVKYRTPRNYRDPEFLGPRIGEQLTMTMLMWSLYWGVGASFAGGDNFVNQAAVLFMFIVLPAYGAASYVPSIVLERTLYTRERSDGLYYPITYLLAKMVDELLLATNASVGNAAATFYAIRFQGSFGTFWLVYVLVLYIGIVLAYGIAAVSPNMDVANALLPAWVTVQLFFAGFSACGARAACAPFEHLRPRRACTAFQPRP